MTMLFESCAINTHARRLSDGMAHYVGGRTVTPVRMREHCGNNVTI